VVLTHTIAHLTHQVLGNSSTESIKLPVLYIIDLTHKHLYNSHVKTITIDLKLMTGH